MLIKHIANGDELVFVQAIVFNDFIMKTNHELFEKKIDDEDFHQQYFFILVIFITKNECNTSFVTTTSSNEKQNA